MQSLLQKKKTNDWFRRSSVRNDLERALEAKLSERLSRSLSRSIIRLKFHPRKFTTDSIPRMVVFSFLFVQSMGQSWKGTYECSKCLIDRDGMTVTKVALSACSWVGWKEFVLSVRTSVLGRPLIARECIYVKIRHASIHPSICQSFAEECNQVRLVIYSIDQSSSKERAESNTRTIPA